MLTRQVRPDPVADDPISLVKRLAVKLNTEWLKRTYPFAAFGSAVSIHYSCDIRRSASPDIWIGDRVYVASDVWLNTASKSEDSEPRIILSEGCQIGRRSTISCRNQIILEADVLVAPSVLIMDHNHNFSNPEMPIHKQGTVNGGKIIIERNCWLGHGAVILCGRGNLVLGRNSVVGANGVVTRSFPPHSVVAGSPARLIKVLDEQTGDWTRIPH